MEKNISEKLEDLIKSTTPDNAQINGFIKANKEYEKLIQDGLTNKRGFNLMTMDEIYNPTLNSSYLQSFHTLNSK